MRMATPIRSVSPSTVCFCLRFSLLASIIAATTPIVQAVTVTQAELQASGSTVTLDQNPVVSAILSTPNPTNGLTLTRWIFLVDDGTGSMDIFNTAPLPGSYTPTVGDKLTIAGTNSPFSGIPELATLTALTKVSSGNPVPLPLIETIPQLAGYTAAPAAGSPFPSFAGHLVTINNVTVSGAAGNFGIANIAMTIADSANNQMALFYNPTTYSIANANLFGSPIPTGHVNATGIVEVFNGAPELIVTSIATVPEPSTMVLASVGLLGIWAMRRVRLNTSQTS